MQSPDVLREYLVHLLNHLWTLAAKVICIRRRGFLACMIVGFISHSELAYMVRKVLSSMLKSR